jgi:hypothetical protein
MASSKTKTKKEKMAEDAEKALNGRVSKALATDVFLSLLIQFSIAFIVLLLISDGLENEAALISTLNETLQRFSGSNLKRAVISILLLIGVFSLVIIALKQVEMIKNFEANMTMFPRRCAEEFLKLVISVGSALSSCTFASFLFLASNPTNSAHNNWGWMLYFTFMLIVPTFSIGLLISMATQTQVMKQKIKNQDLAIAIEQSKKSYP